MTLGSDRYHHHHHHQSLTAASTPTHASADIHDHAALSPTSPGPSTSMSPGTSATSSPQHFYPNRQTGQASSNTVTSIHTLPHLTSPPLPPLPSSVASASLILNEKPVTVTTDEIDSISYRSYRSSSCRNLQPHSVSVEATCYDPGKRLDAPITRYDDRTCFSAAVSKHNSIDRQHDPDTKIYSSSYPGTTSSLSTESDDMLGVMESAGSERVLLNEDMVFSHDDLSHDSYELLEREVDYDDDGLNLHNFNTTRSGSLESDAPNDIQTMTEIFALEDDLYDRAVPIITQSHSLITKYNKDMYNFTRILDSTKEDNVFREIGFRQIERIVDYKGEKDEKKVHSAGPLSSTPMDWWSSEKRETPTTIPSYSVKKSPEMPKKPLITDNKPIGVNDFKGDLRPGVIDLSSPERPLNKEKMDKSMEELDRLMARQLDRYDRVSDRPGEWSLDRVMIKATAAERQNQRSELNRSLDRIDSLPNERSSRIDLPISSSRNNDKEKIAIEKKDLPKFNEYIPKCGPGMVIGFEEITTPVQKRHLPVERAKSDPSRARRRLLTHQKSIDVTPHDSDDSDEVDEQQLKSCSSELNIPYVLHKRLPMNGTAAGISTMNTLNLTETTDFLQERKFEEKKKENEKIQELDLMGDFTDTIEEELEEDLEKEKLYQTSLDDQKVPSFDLDEGGKVDKGTSTIDSTKPPLPKTKSEEEKQKDHPKARRQKSAEEMRRQRSADEIKRQKSADEIKRQRSADEMRRQKSAEEIRRQKSVEEIRENILQKADSLTDARTIAKIEDSIAKNHEVIAIDPEEDEKEPIIIIDERRKFSKQKRKSAESRSSESISPVRFDSSSPKLDVNTSGRVDSSSPARLDVASPSRLELSSPVSPNRLDISSPSRIETPSPSRVSDCSSPARLGDVSSSQAISNVDISISDASSVTSRLSETPSPALLRKRDRSPILFARGKLGISEGSTFLPKGKTQLSPTSARRAKSLDAPVVSLHRLPPADSFSSKDDTLDDGDTSVDSRTRPKLNQDSSLTDDTGQDSSQRISKEDSGDYQSFDDVDMPDDRNQETTSSGTKPRSDESSTSSRQTEEDRSTSSSNPPRKIGLMIESSGSSSLEEAMFPPDEDNTFHDDLIDFPTGIGYPSLDLMVGCYNSPFSLSRTLSRISERSTTSEQERSDYEESTKNSSRTPSMDDESLLSSDHQPSLSSDPPSIPENKIDIPPPPLILNDEWPSPPTNSSASLLDVEPVVSHVETFYMELQAPEEASKVVLDCCDREGSSTDENQTLDDDLASASSATVEGTVRLMSSGGQPCPRRYGSSLSEDTSMGLSSDWDSSTSTVKHHQCKLHFPDKSTTTRYYSGAKSDTCLEEVGAEHTVLVTKPKIIYSSTKSLDANLEDKPYMAFDRGIRHTRIHYIDKKDMRKYYDHSPSASDDDTSSSYERVAKRKKSQSKRRHRVTVDLEVRDGQIIPTTSGSTTAGSSSGPDIEGPMSPTGDRTASV